jgi:hypothetical protein
MNTDCSEKLVDGVRLLEIIFAEDTRPSLRWLREQQARRTIPFIKIGGLVRFEPEKVRAALGTKWTVQQKEQIGPPKRRLATATTGAA